MYHRAPEELVAIADRLVVDSAVLVALAIRVLHRESGGKWRKGTARKLQSPTTSHLKEEPCVRRIIHDVALALEPLECKLHIVAEAKQSM